MTTAKASTSKSEYATPNRQIRALYDDETITVYQAYSADIAEAAIAHQRLSASPDFIYSRMTWIKPSWAWMNYRAGYSYKDAQQARILAIKMRHEHFLELLKHGFTGHGAADENAAVRVQWDPERTPSMRKLPWRSIQIGISRDLSQKWVEEWIDSIEDVTEMAKGLKKAVDDNPDVSLEDLVKMELVPVERVYEISVELKEILQMDDVKG